MSNYVDTITVGGTDYPVNIPNGVKFRNPTSITPETNPVIRKNDLAQSLSSNPDVPPSSNAVKMVTDALSSDLSNYSFTAPTSYTGSKCSIYQNSHYTQSYIQRLGRFVYVNITVECNTSFTGSNPICSLPAPRDFTTLNIPQWGCWDGSQYNVESVLQSGILYMYNGVQGRKYTLNTMYIANDIPS